MKYLKIYDDLVVGTDELTRDDLVKAKNGTYDVIINRIEETVYDADTNEWKPIQNIDISEKVGDAS